MIGDKIGSPLLLKILLFVFLIMPLSSALACMRERPLAVDVYHQITPTIYDFTKNSLELDYIGKDAYSPYGEGHKTFLRGLTVGRQKFDYNISFQTEKSSSVSFACLWVQKVTVTFRYSPTVYVSNEYPQGSPIFRRVLAHEQEHVNITLRVLNDAAERVRNRLQYADFGLRAYGPYQLSDLQSEKDYLKERVKLFMEAFNREMHHQHQKLHNSFDDNTMHDRRAYNREVAKKLEEIFKLNQ